VFSIDTLKIEVRFAPLNAEKRDQGCLYLEGREEEIKVDDEVGTEEEQVWALTRYIFFSF